MFESFRVRISLWPVKDMRSLVCRATLREKRVDRLVLEAELKALKVCLEYFLSANTNIKVVNRSRADRNASIEE
jgi:hypothetical protein